MQQYLVHNRCSTRMCSANRSPSSAQMENNIEVFSTLEGTSQLSSWWWPGGSGHAGRAALHYQTDTSKGCQNQEFRTLVLSLIVASITKTKSEAQLWISGHLKIYLGRKTSEEIRLLVNFHQDLELMESQLCLSASDTAIALIFSILNMYKQPPWFNGKFLKGKYLVWVGSFIGWWWTENNP